MLGCEETIAVLHRRVWSSSLSPSHSMRRDAEEFNPVLRLCLSDDDEGDDFRRCVFLSKPPGP